MTTLTQASSQWANRPADERFTSLPEMLSAMHKHRAFSKARIMSNRDLRAVPAGDSGHRGLQIEVNGASKPIDVSHWAFGQLSQRAKAPAGYLRTLPSPMAADNLNYGLHVARDVEELGLLVGMNPETREASLRAATGPNYGRIWNETIVSALADRFGDGVNGRFRVPGEFGQRVDVTKENTTLYASDRDMFVFLADEENRISVPDRRNGQSGEMARGFFVWNSETGSSSLGISTFLFDYVCMNRIVWGAEDVQEIRIRHTSGAPHRWIEDVIPAIEAYADSTTDGIQQTIAAAKSQKIGNRVDAFLKKRFTSAQTKAIKAAHMADEERPIESLWDAVTAATAYARAIEHQDSRVQIERTAGKILQLAA